MDRVVGKPSHKRLNTMRRKILRKKRRRANAKLREASERVARNKMELLPGFQAEECEISTVDELQTEMEVKLREKLHNEWLERERKAQEEFCEKKQIEERQRLEREAQQKIIQEEWEQQQQTMKDKDRKAAENKERQDALLKEATKGVTENGPWHNPIAPVAYNTEKDRENCPFFSKTGACRFGDRCSRVHFKPSVSCTVLIPGMFSHFSLDQSMRDEYDTDIGLEYEESEFHQHFRDFYRDVLPEFKKIGMVTQFKVCCNFEPHLRGNVYIQYKNENEAVQAYRTFNGRFYGGKQLSCEFTAVTKWKSAICGLHNRNRCPKGRNCNFLHTFRNPGNEFADADVDFIQSPELKRNWSSRSERNTTSHSSRSHHRSMSRRSSQSPPSSRSESSRTSSKSKPKSSRRDRSEKKVTHSPLDEREFGDVGLSKSERHTAARSSERSSKKRKHAKHKKKSKGTRSD